MPGLGSTGPLSGYGTWGPTLTAYSGLTYLWNHPGQERPVGSQGVYPDYLTGVMVPVVVDRGAASQRRRTGKGTVIDVAQVDLAAYMLGTIFLDALGERPRRPAATATTRRTWRRTAATAAPGRPLVRDRGRDDARVGGAARRDRRPALADDPRFATFVGRQRHRDELDELIAAWTREQDAVRGDGATAGGRGRRPGSSRAGPTSPTDQHLRGARVPRDGQPPDPGRDHHGGAAHPLQPGRRRALPSPPPLGSDNEYVITELLGHSQEELGPARRRTDRLLGELRGT